MGGDDHRLALRLEPRKQRTEEIVALLGVLVGDELVEHQNVAVLEQRHGQRQAPPLPGRKIDAADALAADLRDAGEEHLLDHLVGLLGRDVLKAVELAEHVELREDRREMRRGRRPCPRVPAPCRRATISPAVGSRRPHSTFMKVVLPEPLLPTRKTTSPLFSSKSSGPRAKLLVSREL